jgi:L-lactate dehydrogenase complex protein LldF
MIGHPQAAARFNLDEQHVNWHDQALWMVRKKRDAMAAGVKNWEKLRSLAAQIKAHTLSNLDQYLEQFEQNAIRKGIQVHWAVDADEHNKIVYDILAQNSVKQLVKSKSMLTEECGLNCFLEERELEVIDTDLGERIVQLAKEPPSHIVMPAIHKKREEINELFHEHLGTDRSNGDEIYLTRKAREHLRKKFLQAGAGLTGVNFAVAETGGFVVCTNEGNADMGVHAAPLHIACMGIEKIIPKQEHLGIFLRLLARSATGQPITTCSSHFHSPVSGKEIHIVIVDNGRSLQLSRPQFRSSLQCIRCGACLNTCPVYRRSGGHSYGYTIPGPIGSILSPGEDLKKYSTLPFASTLCGSCTDVCPVKIDIHKQLFRWRQVIVQIEGMRLFKTIMMKMAGFVFSHPGIYRLSGKLARFFLKMAPRFLVYSRFNIWGKQRELPVPPRQSFTEWYKELRMKNDKN